MLCDGPWWHHRRGHRLPRDLLTATQSHLSELHCIWTVLYHAALYVVVLYVVALYDAALYAVALWCCITLHSLSFAQDRIGYDLLQPRLLLYSVYFYMCEDFRIIKRCISAPKYIWFQSQIYLIPVLGTGTSNSAPQCTGASKYTLHPLHSPLIHNAMLSTMYWHSTMQCIAMLHNAMLFSELVDKSTEPTPQLIMKSNNSGRNCKYFAAAAAPHYQRSSQL